jgi:hypothetical protein
VVVAPPPAAVFKKVTVDGPDVEMEIPEPAAKVKLGPLREFMVVVAEEPPPPVNPKVEVATHVEILPLV